MSPRTKKHKKRLKPSNDVANSKIYAYFTEEEIAELKSFMKIKDIVRQSN